MCDGEQFDMPAARPSQASVSNAIGAIVNAGFIPAEIRVSADGAFSIEIAGLRQTEINDKEVAVGGVHALPKWGE